MHASADTAKPQVVAAAVIYQSCRTLGLRITLRSVARVAGVSESSLRCALRALARFKSAADCDAEKRGVGPMEREVYVESRCWR
ncbi:MAG: hypothetical protein DRK00_07755 [Thermoprotei archaeon]|nr:MAG: hypothetical protein DRK00_07755 [Thermoprotei archaeon]